MKRSLLIGLGVFGAATAVLADSGSSWNGPYIGAHVGGAWGNDKYNVYDLNGTVPFFNGTERSDGAVWGVQAGFNKSVGSGLVLGIEADTSGTSITGTTGGCVGSGCAESHSRIDGISSLRARLGLAHDNWLIYATGGGALVQGHAIRTITAPTSSINFGDSARSSGSKSTWVAGGGVEYKIRDNWTLGVEYLHYGYDSEAHYYYLDSSIDRRSSGKNDLDVVRVGLNYQFNFGGSDDRYRPMK